MKRESKHKIKTTITTKPLLLYKGTHERQALDLCQPAVTGSLSFLLICVLCSPKERKPNEEEGPAWDSEVLLPPWPFDAFQWKEGGDENPTVNFTGKGVYFRFRFSTSRSDTKLLACNVWLRFSSIKERPAGTGRNQKQETLRGESEDSWDLDPVFSVGDT